MVRKKLLLAVAVGYGLSAFAHGFGEKVVAFYPFRDGAPGTSAVGVTITNLIDKTVFPGRIEAVGTGDAQFSDEHPAKYVFNDLKWMSPVAYENPGSLYFPNAGTKANHATLFFDGVVKYLNDLVAASGNNNNAWKIEFFFKCDTDQYIGNSTDSDGQQPFFFALKGICDILAKGSDTVTHTNADFMARFYDNSGAYRLSPRTLGYRVSDGVYEGAGANTWSAGEGEKMKDGKWHYLSVSSGYNGFSFCGRPNYASEGNNFRLNRFTNTADNNRPRFRVISDPDAVAPMLFNPNGSFRGWISCLKITRNEGITAANMHCSELETCVPRTISHVRFEEGENGAAIANGTRLVNVAGLETVNTNISYFKLGRGQDGTAYYGVPSAYVSSEAGSAVSFTNDVKRKFVLEKDEENRANARGMHLTEPQPVDTTNITLGVGLTYAATDFMKKDDTTPLTFECFARFDFNDWTNRIAAATETEKSVALFWLPWASDQLFGGYANTFTMHLDLKNPAAPKLYVGGYAGGTSYDVPAIADGRWHHYAVSVKPNESGSGDQAEYKVYFDYRKLGEDRVYFYQHTYNSLRNVYCFRSNNRQEAPKTRSGGLHCFNGNIDEVRISNGLLGPADFLRQRNFDGLMINVR